MLSLSPRRSADSGSKMPPPPPSSERGQPPDDRSHFGWIMTGSIVAMLVVWTYIFFGMTALDWWFKAAVTVVALAWTVIALRLRRRRAQMQLELLRRWADEHEASDSRNLGR